MKEGRVTRTESPKEPARVPGCESCLSYFREDYSKYARAYGYALPIRGRGYSGIHIRDGTEERVRVKDGEERKSGDNDKSDSPNKYSESKSGRARGIRARARARVRNYFHARQTGL